MATNKTILTKHAKNMAQLSVYLIIGNLSYEIRRLQVKLKGMIIGFISIYKKDLFDVKIKIYHQTIGVITKIKYSNRRLLDKFPDVRFKN